ncbi:MAG: hypothetical protein SFY68_02725 [Candidatus Sumerlaeia bacterium]|nr:hypothetical protein [Candidatus Sumerlaeia bacterium]
MLKWACILLVIVDLILVGGAAFRFLTAPKAEVQKYVETYEKNAARIQAEAKGGSDFEENDSDVGVFELIEEGDTNTSESSSAPAKTLQQQAAENKPIEMTEDTVFEMDDQGMKQEKLNESKRAMRAVFGTEKRNTVEE